MELLHRHFDIVTVGDHDAFMAKILDWTDWTRDNKYRMMNVNKKELEFTKKVSVATTLHLVMDLRTGNKTFHDYHSALSLIGSREHAEIASEKWRC
jgi:hypothetical protein